MEDSTKEMLGGAGLAGAGAAVGGVVPAAVQALGDAVVDPVRRHADSMNRIMTSSMLDWGAAHPLNEGTMRDLYRRYDNKADSAMQALRAAEEARESLAKRWGGSARTAGGLLAAGGLALGAKGLYDHFNAPQEEPPMKIATYLGARAALAALGLEKIARTIIPGMKFSPEAAHAMEEAGTTLFSGKALNPAALAKARTANAADAAAHATQQQFRAAGAAHGPSSAQYIMSQEPAKLMQAGLTPQHLSDQGFMNAVAPGMLG